MTRGERISAWLHAISDHMAAKRFEWRIARQRNTLRSQIFTLTCRLHEAQRYVDRDRSIERKEASRKDRQIHAARERQDEFENLLRAYIMGQTMIDSELQAAAHRTRDALDSGFGALEPDTTKE